MSSQIVNYRHLPVNVFSALFSFLSISRKNTLIKSLPSDSWWFRKVSYFNKIILKYKKSAKKKNNKKTLTIYVGLFFKILFRPRCEPFEWKNISYRKYIHYLLSKIPLFLRWWLRTNYTRIEMELKFVKMASDWEVRQTYRPYEKRCEQGPTVLIIFHRSKEIYNRQS